MEIERKPMELELEMAIDGNSHLVKRFKALRDLRANEGRVLSPACCAKIDEAAASLQALVDELDKLLDLNDTLKKWSVVKKVA